MASLDEEVQMGRARIALPALVVAALAAGAFGAVARGSGAGRPVPVDVAGGDYAYVMPDVVKGGVVAMRFRNIGKEPHEFAFGRIDGRHTLAEALKGVESGKAVSWVHDLAGPPLLTPGASITITRTLRPGRYFFACYIPNHKGVPHIALGMKRAFTVRGDSGAQLPRVEAVIVAEPKRFAVPVLHAGTQTIELRNRAGTGRGFELSTLNPGKTLADAGRWGGSIDKTGKLPAGLPPFTALGAIQTIPNGTSVFLTVTLDAGRRYRLSDDDSGITTWFTAR
jgi:uncharacterized cupredoxin-like copper-binding protein